MTMSRRFRLTLLSLMTLGLGVALWSTTHRGTAGAASVSPDAPIPGVTASARASAAVGLFRRQAVAGDAPAFAPSDMAFRRASTHLDHARVFVGNRPGKDVCVVGVFDSPRATVEACGPEDTVTTKPTVTSLASATAPNLVAGVAPDGYTRVVLVGEDGTVTEDAVTDNAYAVETPSPYRSIRLVRPDGTSLTVTG